MRDVERFPIQLAVNDPGGSRTRDLRIKSPLLYQLSYRVGLRNVFGESRKSHYVVLCDSN